MGVTCLNVGIAPAYTPPTPPAPPPQAIANVTPPSWSSPLVFGVANNFNQGGWTGDIAPNRSWIFLITPVTGSSANYTGAAPNTIATHTPRAPAVGGTSQLVIRETVYLLDGVTVAGTADSAPVLITVAAQPLAIQTVIANEAFLIGQPVTPDPPVSVSGGFPPYTITTANLSTLVPGVSMSSSTGALSGTPQGPVLSNTGVMTIATDSGGSPQVSTTWNLSVGPVGTTSLPALIYSESALAVSNATGSYDGTTATQKTYLGNVTLGPLADPGGSSTAGITQRRIYSSQSTIAGGWRSETLWLNKLLSPGVDVWMAQAVMLLVPLGSTSSDDELLWFQSHTPASGSTQPDFAFFFHAQGNRINFQSVYATQASSGGTAGPYTVGTYISLGSLPAVGTWYKVILHFRAGYQASQNPRIDMWAKKSTDADYVQYLNNYTQFNTYNNPEASYIRNGPYRSTSAVWPTPSVEMAMSPLYYGIGTNLYTEASSSLGLL